MRLKHWDERTRQAAGHRRASCSPKLFGEIPGVLAFPINPPSLGQSPIDKPVQFVLQTLGSPTRMLQRAVDQLIAEARQNPALMNLDTRPEAQQAAAQGRHRPREAGDARHRRRDGRPHARDACWAAGRSRASSATASSTTSSCRSADVDRDRPGRSARDLRARPATASMVPLANLVHHRARRSRPRSSTTSTSCARRRSPRPWRRATRLGEALDLPRGRRPPRCRPAIADRPQRPEPRVPRVRPAASTSRSCWRWRSSSWCWRRSSRASIDPFVIMLTVPLSMTGALLAL